ncbi:hypothetical protein Hdeb2414_s0363g00877131 [Helianthus debilis subsp. tardiflorus]
MHLVGNGSNASPFGALFSLKGFQERDLQTANMTRKRVCGWG